MMPSTLSNNKHKHSFTAIGTSWTITFYQEVIGLESIILPMVYERIALFDSVYSRFRDDSWVNQLCRNGGVSELPIDALPLLDTYKELYAITKGAVTPLIGQALVDAGYDASYSLKEKEQKTQVLAWEDALVYEPPFLTVTQPCQLDFGAIGKGYLIDIVSELLFSYGITEYCVDAGGDIAHCSASGNDIRVGLEDPDDAKSVIGVVPLSNKCIAGSAGNRRKWGKYNHIMNPFTGFSPDHIAALWVIADSTRIADAMATALFFTEPEVLLAQYAFDYLILNQDRSVQGSIVI